MKKRTKRSIFRWLASIFIVISILYWHKTLIRYGYKAYHYLQQNKTNKNLPNRLCFPAVYSVHGIDVSRYQPDINWSTLKAVDANKDTVQFQFVIIKATEGLLWEDPTFKDNWNDARKNKVIRGAYHYFKPASSPRLQATNFINSVNLKAGDLPPVVDIEETGNMKKKELVASLKSFISAIEKNYGVKPVIYSNINFIEDYLVDDFGNYKFWVAHYYVDKLRISSEINWVFWQHHDKAHLLNSSSNYDVNVFNGNAGDLKKLLIR